MFFNYIHRSLSLKSSLKIASLALGPAFIGYSLANNKIQTNKNLNTRFRSQLPTKAESQSQENFVEDEILDLTKYGFPKEGEKFTIEHLRNIEQSKIKLPERKPLEHSDIIGILLGDILEIDLENNDNDVDTNKFYKKAFAQNLRRREALSVLPEFPKDFHIYSDEEIEKYLIEEMGKGIDHEKIIDTYREMLLEERLKIAEIENIGPLSDGDKKRISRFVHREREAENTLQPLNKDTFSQHPCWKFAQENIKYTNSMIRAYEGTTSQFHRRMQAEIPVLPAQKEYNECMRNSDISENEELIEKLQQHHNAYKRVMKVLLPSETVQDLRSDLINYDINGNKDHIDDVTARIDIYTNMKAKEVLAEALDENPNDLFANDVIEIANNFRPGSSSGADLVGDEGAEDD